eukprot:scaffold294_cov221-Amphora_coffeaeformis.AAC.6
MADFTLPGGRVRSNNSVADNSTTLFSSFFYTNHYHDAPYMDDKHSDYISIVGGSNVKNSCMVWYGSSAIL